MRLMAFVLGMWLMLVNLIGLGVPLRSAELVNETATYFTEDLKLDEASFREQLAALDPSDRRAYFTALTQLVSDGILHYWREDGMDEYRLRLPWSENFLIRAMSYVNPKFFRLYEFQDVDRALERGVGLCSQHAIIQTGILRAQGTDARLVELNGHVVLTAEVEEGEWWVLDPDYGVVIPMSLDAAEEHADEVAQIYARAGFSDYDVDKVEEWFSTRDNVIYAGGSESYQVELWLFEQVAYVAKWMLPPLLMLPWLLAGGWQRLRSLLEMALAARRRHRPVVVQVPVLRVTRDD